MMTEAPLRSKLYRPYVLILCFWMGCLPLQAQLSERGTLLSRNMGPATLGYRIDSTGTGVICSFRWKDSLVGLTHLNRYEMQRTLRFGNKQESGTCIFSLILPGRGSDLGQLVMRVQENPVSKQDTPWRYFGVVTSWHMLKGDLGSIKQDSNSNPIKLLDSVVYPLTPILRVVTKPKGIFRNSASVTIYSGSMLLYTVLLTQASPFVTNVSDIILGEVKIDSGMQLTLRIPSYDEPGSIQLKATYQSIDIPPTPINAMIATWNL
jgi:hypothetical protein